MVHNTIFPLIAFDENDVPGVKLLYNFPKEYSILQLNRLLKCKGLPVSGNKYNIMAS